MYAQPGAMFMQPQPVAFAQPGYPAQPGMYPPPAGGY
jgi:hypothetical protein